MDKIQFIFSQPKLILENSSIQSYQIKVVLNGKILGDSMFNTAYVIAASKFNFSEFFLFTCSCGVPECAGFHEPIIQEKFDGTVKWIFPKENYYQTEKLNYQFSQMEFENEFESAYQKIVSLEKKHFVCQSMIDEYGEALSIDMNLEHIIKSYQEKNDFHLFLKENLKDFINQEFFIKHKRDLSKYTFTIKDLLYKYNFSSSKDQDVLYFINFIKEGKFDLLQEFTRNFLEDNDLTLNNFFEFEFDSQINLEIEYLSFKKK